MPSPIELVLCLSLILDSGIYDVRASPEVESNPGVKGLDPAQTAALAQLKTAVSPNVPHEYMKQDTFLLGFLKASNFNATKAEAKVNQMVKWRKEAGVDSWEKPGNKLDAFSGDYPQLENGIDKQGSPLKEIPIGKWDIRKSMLSGTILGLATYGVRSIERCTTGVREQQAKGLNVSQWSMLVNMEGWNLDSGCASCMPFYLAFVNALEKYYPNSVKEIILVNNEAPDTFTMFYILVKPFMSQSTRNSVTIFGTDKAEWKPYVDQRVEAHQLAEWFGGTKAAPKLPETKKGGVLGTGIGK